MAKKTLIGHESKALHQSWITRLALNMRQKFKYLLEVFDMLRSVQTASWRNVLKTGQKTSTVSVTRKSRMEKVSRLVHSFAFRSYQKNKRMKNQNLLFTRLMLEN